MKNTLGLTVVTLEKSRWIAAMQGLDRELWLRSREFTTLKGIIA